MAGNSERLGTVDVMKGIAMLLVIFDHSGASLTPVLDHIEVPIFFLISGYFFSVKRGFRDFLWRKFLTLIVPYVIFAILFAIPYLCFNHVSDLKTVIIDIFLRPANGPLWFLKALFWSQVLYYCISKALKGVKPLLRLVISILLAALMTLVIPTYADHLPEPILWTGIMQGLIGLPLLGFGQYAQERLPKAMTIVNRNKRPWLINASIMITALLGACLTGIDGVHLHALDLGLHPYTFYPCVVFSGIAFAFFCNLLTSFSPLRYIGRNSLAYFGLHYLVIYTIIEAFMLPWWPYLSLITIALTTPLVMLWLRVYKLK